METAKVHVVRKHVPVQLMLILVVGSLLRFYGLGSESLWNDELSSWRRSTYEDFSTVISEGVRPDVHPPGYHAILYLVEKYIGDSESTLRFPSALSGTISLYVVFLLGLRLYSHEEGLMASALMAVLWCPIYYSQEVRPYSMLLLFTLLATYFWLLVVSNLRRQTKASYYAIVAYVLSAIACSYLHYFGLYLVGLQGLGAAISCIRKRKAWLSVAAIYSAISLAYSPWVPTMWEHLNRGPIWISPPAGIARTSLACLRFFFNGSRAIVLFVLVMYSYLLLGHLYQVLSSSAYKNRRMTAFSPGLLLAAWLIVPFAGAYTRSRVSTPVLSSRNLIISLPAAYLLLSRSITQLPLRSRHRAVATCGLIGLLLVHLLFRRDYYSTAHKEQFREAVGFIVERDHLYKDSLIIGYAWHQDYFNYYFERRGSPRRVTVIAGHQKDIPKVGELITRQDLQYMWYIRGHRVPAVAFVDYLQENLTLIEHKELVGADVWLFQK